MRARPTIVMVLLFAAACCKASDSEWEDGYVSIYGGWGATDSGTIEGTATDYEYAGFNFLAPVYWKLGTYDIHNRYENDNGFLAGIRVGAWLRDKDEWSGWPQDEGKGWGAALDMSYFKIDSDPDDTTMHIVPVSLLMLYRHPFGVSEEFPFGRIQPYGGFGIALVYGKISTPTTHYYYTGPTTIEAAGFGGSIHVGCAWKFNQSIGFFIEYRYFVTKLEGEIDHGRNTHYYATEGEIETSVSAHQLLSGVSFNF